MFGSGDLGFGLSIVLQDEFSAPAQKVGDSMGGLEGKTDQAARSIQRNVNRMQAGFMSFLGAVALAAPLWLATTASMEFGAQMSATGAKARATAQEMALLRENALELGDATKYSATQVGQGQEFLAQAGFNVQDVMSSMPGMLDLAAAGNLNLARSADIASNVLSGFQLPATQMTRVADVLALTASRANVNVEMLGESFKMIAPMAATLKVPIEEVSAMIGLLGDNGLQGTMATTTLSSALARLASPTKEMQQRMDDLNISFFDNGQFVGMAEMLDRVTKATKGMTDQQKLAVASDLFGVEGLKNALALLNSQKTVMQDGVEVTLQGADALRAFTHEMENSAGAARQMAARMMDNLAGDVEEFSSVWESTMITVGSSMEGTQRIVVQFATEALSLFKGLISSPVGQWIARISFAALGLVAAFMAFSAVTTMIIPALWGMAVAGWAAVAPWLPFIAVGAAVVGVIYMLYQGWQNFQQGLEDGTQQTGILGWFEKIAGVIMGVMEVWRSWNGETFELSEEMYDHLERLGILDWVLTLGTYVVRVKDFMTGLWEGFTRQVQPAIAAFKQIWNNVSNLIAAVTDFNISIGKATSGIEGWGNAGEALGSILGFLLDVALVPLIGGIEMLGLALAGVIALGRGLYLLFTDYGAFKEYAAQVGGAVVDSVRSYLHTIQNFIGTAGENMLRAGGHFINQLWQGMKDAWTGLKAWLSSSFSTLLQDVPLLGGLVDMLSDDTGALSLAGAGVGADNSLSAMRRQEIAQSIQHYRSTEKEVNHTREEKIKNINIVLQSDGRNIAEVNRSYEELDDAR